MGLNNYLFCDAFIDLISQTYNGCGAVERYQLDQSGSHLFVTATGEPTALIIRNKLDIHAALKYNKEANEKASDTVIKEIQSGDKVLYTGNGNDLDVSPQEWGKHLYPADHFMMGDKKIYCATIQNDVPGIDKSRIVSYQSYLKQRK